jgi:hypothetical protein
MTRDGRLFERPMSVPRTGGNAGSVLLPTPAAQEPGGTAEAHLERKNRIDGANRTTPTHLAFITALLPTPAVNDMGEGKTPEKWDAWTDEMKQRHGNGNGHGKSLAIEAQRLLPTPRVSASRTSRSAAVRRDSMSAPSLEQALEIARGETPREFTDEDSLPPSWRGATTPPQSNGGNEPSEGRPRLPLTNEDGSPPASSSG